MNKLLTIIIPTYNMEVYLPKCLSSLIVDDESLMNMMEVLIVNDGSKDRSSEIAHDYYTSYPDVFRVIDKENGNYGSCVNIALPMVNGEYVKILDADDYFDNDVLPAFLSFLQNIDADVVLSDFMQITAGGERKALFEFNVPDDRVVGISEMTSMDINHALMHGVTYRTELVRSINYRQTEGISYTDQEWISIPIAYAKTVAHFPRVLYCYLVEREGQTMDPVVFEKTFWMEVKGARVMIDALLARMNELSHDGRHYMKERIIRRSSIIAYSYFWSQKETKNWELLVDYDNYLKEKLPDVWSELGEEQKRCGIKYIKYWREKGYPKRPMIVRLIRLKDKLGLHR